MPPPPPPAGGGNGAKVAGIIIGAVVVGALIVGGVLIFGGSDDESDKAETANTPSASADITTPSPDTSDSAAPSLSAKPTQSEVPYVVLDPGQCFDHPSLSSAVSSVTKRSCGTPHNGEVITNQKITGSYASEAALQKKVLESCQADASERLKTIPQDGTQYYYYAIYPALATYQRGAGDTISCALTLSNEQDGPKLDKPLPK